MKQQSLMFRSTRNLTGIAATLALSLFTLPSLAAPAWDIVGIKLGMTEQQARAAIAAHSAQAQLREQTLKFNFNDGARQQETSSFLASIQAGIPPKAGSSDSETIQLEFSPPPREQRVIRVRRTVSSYQNPPPLERMESALTQKYGKPTESRTHGIGIKSNVMSWVEAGKTLCGHRPGKAMGFIGVGQSPRDLNKFYQYQQQKLAPADLSQCSAMAQAKMDYKEGGSSVTVLEVELRDYGYALPSLEATAKWLDGLEAEARKARLNSGDTPKL